MDRQMTCEISVISSFNVIHCGFALTVLCSSQKGHSNSISLFTYYLWYSGNSKIFKMIFFSYIFLHLCCESWLWELNMYFSFNFFYTWQPFPWFYQYLSHYCLVFASSAGYFHFGVFKLVSHLLSLFCSHLHAVDSMFIFWPQSRIWDSDP